MKYVVTLKVEIDVKDDDAAHRSATRMCDTIGHGKGGEVREIYADRVVRIDDKEDGSWQSIG